MMQQKTIKTIILSTIAVAAIATILLFIFSPNKPTKADPNIADLFSYSPTIGNKDAKNSIILFEDLDCPHCQEFHNGIYQKLMRDYINTKKAKIKLVVVPVVTKNPPVTVAYCLAEQSPQFFQKYIDFVYTDIDSLQSSKKDFYTNPMQIFTTTNNQTQKALDKQTTIPKLSLPGLNLSKLQSCIQKPYMQKIGTTYASHLNSLTRANKWGKVAGTPTLIINGQHIRDFTDYKNIQSHLDK
jgi:protein-disulfide isomerase